MQGRIQDFFQEGVHSSLPINHIVFFFCRIPVVLENRRSSQGGGGVRTPCTLPLDPPLGCDVVVKEMHSDIMSDHNLQSFLREAEMASRCHHPCLLQFIGATTDERPLIITEIMECSLRTRLYSQGASLLSEQEITIISLDVAKALNYLHQKPQPIIHHDISSSNVLLGREGGQWRAEVSDYGTANFVCQSSINYAGAAVYCAPEFLHPDPRKPIICQVSISTGVQNKLLVKSACL